MKVHVFLIILLIFSSVVVNGGFFYARAAIATTQDVVINEILYDPVGADTNHEWVELYNAGTEPITLASGSGADGWRIFDGANHVFATSTVLGAGAYMVITQDSAQFLKDYPAFVGTLSESSFVLDNASGRVALRVGPNGALWSDIQYTSAWGGGGNGYTLAKKHTLGADTAQEWAQSASVGGTPGASNTFVENSSTSSTSTFSGISQNTNSSTLLPVPTVPNTQTENNKLASGELLTSAKLFINEIYPAPHTGEKEWVELYNPNAAAVDLTGWKLTDNSSTTTLYGAIGAERFVYWEFKGVLNNDGDVIALYRPDGSVADKLIYGDWFGSVLPSPENGQSLARFPDGATTGNSLHDFFLTTTPTRAGPNKVSASGGFSKKTEQDTRAPSRDRVNGVEFSEILPNPVGPDDAPHGEFIELVNHATSTVDMSGWRIEFGDQTYRIASGTLAGAGQFVLMYRDTTRIFLSNEKGMISLMDARGALMDRMKYEDAEPGISINRTGKDLWEWSMAPTPAAENRVVPPNHPPEPVMSIEGDMFPGNQLWFDASDSYDADGDTLLFIWIFSDGDRVQGRWVSHVFDDTKTHRVTLIAIDAHKRARALTHQLKMNEAYDSNFVEDIAEESVTSTQSKTSKNAKKNIVKKNASGAGVSSVSKSKPLKVATISGASVLDAGTRVSVRGIVVAAPGEFASQTLYIADADDMGSAVQVYMQKKMWPTLKRGDSVQVEGEIGKAYGAERIKIKTADDIDVFGHGASIEPLHTAVAEVPASNGAALVSVEGTIVDDADGGFALADESGQISLGLKRGTALPKGLAHVGDTARITGIAVPAKNGMQILPRDARDVEITGRDEYVASASAKHVFSPAILFGIITLCGVCGLSIAWWRVRQHGSIEK